MSEDKGWFWTRVLLRLEVMTYRQCGGYSYRSCLASQVIAITDGEPAGEPINTTANVIRNAKGLVASSQYGPGAIAFQFAQVRARV